MRFCAGVQWTNRLQTADPEIPNLAWPMQNFSSSSWTIRPCMLTHLETPKDFVFLRRSPEREAWRLGYITDHSLFSDYHRSSMT